MESHRSPDGRGGIGLKAVICLHGFTGTLSSWDAVLEGLSPDVIRVCPAIVGHDPELPLTGRRFEDEVDRLAESIRSTRTRLGDESGPCHLVGYSMGARLALGLLIRHRQLFAAATLLGDHHGLATDSERRQRLAADEALARKVELEGVERFIDDWQRLPLFQTQAALPSAILEAQRCQRLRHSASGLAHALRVVSLGQMPDYRSDLPRLDLPVHLMVGERDEKFRHIAESMVALLPRADVEVVPRVGHNLILEAPRAVAAAVRRELLS